MTIRAFACVALVAVFWPSAVLAQEPPEPKSEPAPEKQADEPSKPKAKAKAKSKSRRPEHRHADKSYMGREIAEVMSYLGADWLIRETRIEEEQPERMLDALEIKPGMVVADVGAGVGYHAVRMAKRVGPEGKVLATDIQPQMIEIMKRNLRATKTTNVVPILCTATDPKLPAGKVDLILMVDVYHECSDPETVLKGLHAALKPGGRLVLVEFRAEDPDVPIKPEHKMTVEQVRKEIEPRGFRFAKLDDFLPWQHIIIFEKPAPAPEPGVTLKP